MQERRAVRIDASFGVARRAAGVTHCRRRALVELGPVKYRWFRGDDLFVSKHLARRIKSGRVARPYDDVTFDSLQVPGHAREQRDDRVVDDDYAVLGMVDDVRELFGKESQVEGVKHGSHAGNCEVGFEMFLGVPAKGADSIALLDANPFERRR